MTMRLDPKDFAGRPRDSSAETALANELRALEPSQAFRFVWEYVGLDPLVGLELSKRVLRDPRAFEALLARGYREADVSSMRWWLEACVARIGARRALRLLANVLDKDPSSVHRCMYQTRFVLVRSDPSLVAELDEIEAKAVARLQERGPKQGPYRS